MVKIIKIIFLLLFFLSLDAKDTKSLHQENSQTQNIATNLRLLSIDKNENSLILKFNKNISKNDFKKYNMSSKNSIKYVFDFKAKKDAPVSKIKTFVVKEVRIAQFKDNIARVVLENDNEFGVNCDINENEVVLNISDSKNSHKAKNKKDVENNDKTKNKSDKKNKEKKLTNDKTDKNKDKKKLNDNDDDEDILVQAPIKKYSSAKGKLVVIDPGHGGKDPGSSANNIKEKNIVLSIAKKTGSILKSRGYAVKFTRQSDVFVNLKSRTAIANRLNADMFVSIHLNAGPAGDKSSNIYNGLETFFLSPSDSQRSKDVVATENKGDLDDMNHFSKNSFLNFLNREKIVASNKLAIDIQKNILASVRRFYSIRDSGVREAPFWVLAGAEMPAVLIEAGYVTNLNESRNLNNSKYQNRIAIGIANGIDAFFAKNR